MTVTADSNGRIHGQFVIPAGVAGGEIPFEIIGAGGSRGLATYSASNVAITSRKRKVVLRSCIRDPLAQTFVPDADFQCSAVDLLIEKKTNAGNPIYVELRSTLNSYPANEILARARLEHSSQQEGQINRFIWDQPVYLHAGTEYAIVAMCDDDRAELGVAQLGKWDNAAKQWITSQPYRIGVLLSSSNTLVWTAHQDMDLFFNLLGTNYSAPSRTFDLGTIAVTNANHFIVLADIDLPTNECAVEFALTMPDSTVYRVQAGQPVVVATDQTGNVQLSATLRGTATISPVLFSGVQVVHGRTETTGTYITTVMPAGAGSTVTVTFESYTPGASAVAVEVQPSTGGSTWTTVPVESGTPVDNGWEEVVHQLTGYDSSDVRVRLSLSGTAQARPFVRKLRVIVT